MHIDKIKKKGSKYQIILDSGKKVDVAGEVIIKNNLMYDKYIDSDLLIKIFNDKEYYDTYNKVVKKIMQRLRSEYEIREFLKKQNIIDNDIEKMIVNLKNMNLIDDERFARAFINDKINLSLDGPRKIANQLEKYKVQAEVCIPKKIIDERIDKLILKKSKLYQKYSSYVIKNKITTYLINLGYDLTDINNHLHKIKSNPEETEKQMKKIYDKLSSKYTEDKLIYNLKNKLYQKGFNKEEIENFIEKNKA